jgi:hypothetical protein
MKHLAVFLASSLSVMAADLSAVKTVYLLPMSSGLDQYLAIRLTRDGAFQVVTDPQKADAIFTDRIGSNFEQTLKDLYSPPKKQDGKLENDDFSKPSMQPLSHGRGSLFLVDRESRVVVWSTFAKPRSANADDMNGLATKIVEQLDKSRKGK